MARRKKESINLAMDYDKIEELLNKKGLNLSRVSMILGYNQSTIHDRKARGVLWPESDATKLALLLDVKVQEITSKAKPDLIEDKTDDQIRVIMERVDNLTHEIEKMIKMVESMQISNSKEELLKEEMEFISVLFSTTPKIYEQKIMKEARIRGLDDDKIKMAMKHMGYTQTAINGMGNTHQVLWSRPVI